jgi:hypothetical protein
MRSTVAASAGPASPSLASVEEFDALAHSLHATDQGTAALGLGVARDVEKPSLFALARKLRDEAVLRWFDELVDGPPALAALLSGLASAL